MIYYKDNPVGFLGYKQKVSQKIKHNFLILNLYIDSDYQGKWTWNILYQHVEKEILKNEKKLLRLHCKVTNTNIPAINFFMKKWFQKIWEENFSIYDQKDDKYYGSIIFEKIIKNT